MQQMKICQKPKIIAKMSPWWILQVTKLPIEAKNKMVNQIKSCHPTWKSWAWANRKGSSKKSLPTIMQYKGMSLPRLSRGWSACASSKDWVSA